MAGITIRIDTRQVSKALTSLRRELSNLQPAFEDFGTHMLNSTQKTFEQQGRPDKWAPLSERTKASRPGPARRSGQSRGTLKPRVHKTLIDTGRLINSITYQASASRLEVGTDVEYAATHQYGSKKRNIPARPYLQVLPEDEVALVKAIERQLGSALR